MKGRDPNDKHLSDIPTFVRIQKPNQFGILEYDLQMCRLINLVELKSKSANR